MHYHCEIVMPPTKDVHKAVTEVLAPFCEESDDRDSLTAFWDWWKIGGRWSGTKVLECAGDERVNRFLEMLHERGVTVSGIQFGKQELRPASQVDLVDRLWVEHFPDLPFTKCPLFKHAGDFLEGDVMQFKDAPMSLKSERVIFATYPEYKDRRTCTASFMVAAQEWNGCNYLKTVWEGTFSHAVQMCGEHYSKVSPEPDWLVVTVDYHS